jgi:hypothetical protein
MLKAAQRPQHQQQPDRKTAGKGSDDDQRAGGPIHHEFP